MTPSKLPPLPNAPAPFAGFILNHLMQPLAPSHDAPRAVVETEHPFTGDNWFWTDDNAKALELLTPPALWPSCGGAARESFRFLASLCRGPFIFHRTSHPRMLRLHSNRDAAAYTHAFLSIEADLRGGAVGVGMRFHDGRDTRNLRIAGHRLRFTAGNATHEGGGGDPLGRRGAGGGGRPYRRPAGRSHVAVLGPQPQARAADPDPPLPRRCRRLRGRGGARGRPGGRGLGRGHHPRRGSAQPRRQRRHLRHAARAARRWQPALGAGRQGGDRDGGERRCALLVRGAGRGDARLRARHPRRPARAGARRGAAPGAGGGAAARLGRRGACLPGAAGRRAAGRGGAARGHRGRILRHGGGIRCVARRGGADGGRAGGRRQLDGFWNFAAGLAPWAFKALARSPDADLRRVAARHEGRISTLRTIIQLQLRRSLRMRGDAVEVRTSALSGETNSETQPWVALALVPQSGEW